MPCSITVTSVAYSSGNIYLSGTTSGCLGTLTLNISGTCGTSSFTGTGNILPGTVFWSATIPFTCACGGPISFTVTCPTMPSCTVTYSSSNLCCCPTITGLSDHLGQCNNAGTQQSVDIYIGYTSPPAGCPFIVQINWGDGSTLQTVTLTNTTPNSYQINHYYNIGSTYTATVSIVSPSGCPPDTQTTTFTIPAPCPNCSSFSFLRFLCKLFEYIFVFFSVVALILLFSVCSASMAVPYIIAAAIALVLFILICRKCLCGIIPKLLGEILFTMGLALIMFFLPPRVACFPSQILLNLLIVGSVVFGLIFIITWYNTNKFSCPLTICDFWAVIRDCGILAIIVMSLLAFIIPPAGYNPVSLLIALFIATTVYNTANGQITANTAAGNC